MGGEASGCLVGRGGEGRMDYSYRSGLNDNDKSGLVVIGCDCSCKDGFVRHHIYV